ncbi:hypothetical protein Golax_019743 [Gossypium laxum]|uniref:Uncharacterized protein n=1 Tax=Gossypium laxum TaxID=34288 RepID=A0A7J8Z795_9ROSI|nr:hypothetical protein [Gossypium laxum]
MIPELEQRKNMVNQESFLSQRIVKVVEQLKKNCKDNWEKEVTQVINICSKRGCPWFERLGHKRSQLVA